MIAITTAARRRRAKRIVEARRELIRWLRKTPGERRASGATIPSLLSIESHLRYVYEPARRIFSKQHARHRLHPIAQVEMSDMGAMRAVLRPVESHHDPLLRPDWVLYLTGLIDGPELEESPLLRVTGEQMEGALHEAMRLQLDAEKSEAEKPESDGD